MDRPHGAVEVAVVLQVRFVPVACAGVVVPGGPVEEQVADLGDGSGILPENSILFYRVVGSGSVPSRAITWK